MMRNIFTILILSCSGLISFAQQNRSISEDIRFADYLISNKLYDDCTLLLHQTLNQDEASSGQKDSIYLRLGQVYFKKDINDSAIISFDNISQNSSFFNESRFLKSYILSTENKFWESAVTLGESGNISTKDSIEKQLYLAGISLLMRDTAQYLKISSGFLKNSSDVGHAQKNLNELYKEIQGKKDKSGFLAGTLSAIFPGAGKIYAGKTLQGITTFLPVAIMGVQAYEAYKVGGVNTARFYIYSGLFSIFYIGNIWGSVLSVSVVRNEFTKKINDQILFNMRIPVQKFFR